MIRTGLHELEPGAGDHPAVHHPDRRDDAAVLVVLGVEDQRLQRGVGVAGRRRDALADRVEQLGDALTGLGRDLQDVLRRDAEDLLDLHRIAVGVGRGQIDLVQRGDDLEVVLEREVAVRQRLRLDALGGVDDEHHPLAGGERPADLVAEVDVAGRVDQVQDVALPVHPDVLRLDRDPPLPLEVHRIEVLRAHVAGIDGAGQLEHPIRERRLAVVDVSDDGEVADSCEVHRLLRGLGGKGQAATARRHSVDRRTMLPARWRLLP